MKNILFLKIPARNDPRYLLMIFLSIYVFYTILDPEYSRSFSQYFVSISVCVICDLLFQILFWGAISVFPLSAFISGHGIFLIVSSPNLWIYAAVAFFTLLLKFVVKWKGKHIFNPNNIGIVIGLLFLGGYMTTASAMWKGADLIHALAFLLGAYIAIKVNRHFLVLSFLLSFIFFGMINTYYYSNFTSWFYFFPMFGTTFSLYLFYMITDPQTSPSARKLQLLAGFTLALFDAFFRYKEQKYSLLFASTCNTIFVFLFSRAQDYFKKLPELETEKN